MGDSGKRSYKQTQIQAGSLVSGFKGEQGKGVNTEFWYPGP